jgi:CHAT domain-containing protein
LLQITRPDGTVGFLIESSQTSITPSLAWWYAKRNELTKLDVKPRDLLVMADPLLDPAGCEVESPIIKELLSSKISFEELKHSEKEAKIVSSYGAGSSETLLRERATSEHLQRATPINFKVLHFATHAVSGGTLQTSLLVFGCAPKLDSLMGENLNTLALNGQLVVLSACDTDVGTVISGEGVDNLTYGFLRAGAGSVIASRRLIRDDTPLPLMEAFYKELSKGASVDEALREAKLQLIRNGSDPAIWSSFNAVGFGEMRIPLKRSVFPEIKAFMSANWWLILLVLALIAALASLIWWMRLRSRVSQSNRT